MKHSTLFDRFTKLKEDGDISEIPSLSNIAVILGVSYSTIAARKQRDSEYSDEEIQQIEAHIGVYLSWTGDIECVELDYIHIRPSCGKGTYVIDEADITPVKLGKELIQDVWGADPVNLKLFKSSGDSMSPIIEDGNILLVDVSKTDFNNGGIFLLTINNDWFIKRLRLRLTGELDIISDNDKYPMETLQPDSNIEIIVKGRVIKNLSKGL